MLPSFKCKKGKKGVTQLTNLSVMRSKTLDYYNRIQVTVLLFTEFNAMLWKNEVGAHEKKVFFEGHHHGNTLFGIKQAVAVTSVYVDWAAQNFTCA